MNVPRTVILMLITSALAGILFYYRILPGVVDTSIPYEQSRTVPSDSGISSPNAEPPPGNVGTDSAAQDVPAPAAERDNTNADTITIPQGVTSEGIFYWTNERRRAYALAPLTANLKLEQAARQKALDMLERQYFAHVAPDGTDAGTLARQAGYAYVSVAENLALGNYATSQEIVDAWMESEGHRANILKETHQDIGIAATQGTFEGKRVWVAVQIFGRPSSACPAPSAALKANIELYETEIGRLTATIENARKELELMEPKWGSAYNQKIDEYNGLVRFTNGLIDDLKSFIAQYNAEVQTYNSCIAR